jgi:hypothetical protein
MIRVALRKMGVALHEMAGFAARHESSRLTTWVDRLH